MVAAWAAEGIGTGQVRRMRGRNPGLYIIRTDAAGERSFHYWRDSAPARDLFAGPDAAATRAALAATTSSTSRGSVCRSTARPAGRSWPRPWRNCAGAAGASPSTPTSAPAAGPTATSPRRVFREAMAAADLVFASAEDLDWLYGAGGEAEVLAQRGRAEIALKSGGDAPTVRVLWSEGDATVPAPRWGRSSTPPRPATASPPPTSPPA